MLELKNRFTVLHDNNTVFSDFTFEAEDYQDDTFTVDLDNAQDYLYIGLYKKFNNFFPSFVSANGNTNILAVEYFNKEDEVFKSLTVLDKTKGFIRDGFIKWEKPKDTEGRHLWGDTEINGKTLFWIRIRPSVSHSATVFRGLSVLFSDDSDLTEERSTIVSKHAPVSPAADAGTFILKHQAARKEIVQKLRNRGNRKCQLDPIDGIRRFKDLTAFDLLDIEQIREASKWLTLSKIFLQELSDEEEDKFERLGEAFESASDSALEVFYLSIDVDDDGETDENEQLANTRIDLVTL